MEPARQIRDFVHESSRVRAMEARLRELVEIPSSCRDAAGLDRMEAAVGRALSDLGFTTTRARGDVLVARRAGSAAARPVLLVGHLDTVYPPDDRFAGLEVIEDTDRRMLRGPGAVDMKGGLVVMLAAIEALAATGRLERGALTVLLNRDEEVGSPASADTIAEMGAEHALALVLEPGFDLEDGATTVVVERAGLARVRVTVKGVESHAGNQPELGLSAVATAARMVAPIDALSAPESDLLVKVCTFEGGHSINQVPGNAVLGIDVRFRSLEQWEAVRTHIERIAAATEDCNPLTGDRTQAAAEVLGLKVPMPRRPDAEPYLETVLGAAAALGLRLVPGRRNGTSDGNNTARAGTPTIDGLGAVGVGMHVSGEEAVRAGSLPERAALLAVTLARVWGCG